MSEKVTLEENFKMLDDLIAQLQSDQISLEESIGVYTKGMQLIAECKKTIEDIDGRLINLKEAEHEN